jgi:hypothetical protein
VDTGSNPNNSPTNEENNPPEKTPNVSSILKNNLSNSLDVTVLTEEVNFFFFYFTFFLKKIFNSTDKGKIDSYRTKYF